MQIQLPEKVSYILERLHKSGYEAYAVGGCVRDALLGREPEDWDITTSAKPEEVKVLFSRTLDTGLQHGTVTVMLDKEGFEVTTYRIDGEYTDGRHPKEVAFTSDLLEDLKRRDFTINAMAYNETEGLVDAFDGAGDLKRGIIQCVGNALERFQEDALRILRAVRFAAQLDFQIETKTREAIEALAGNLEQISAERIRVELDKLLCSKHPERLLLAKELGVTKVVLPEFDAMVETAQVHPHHMYDVGRHCLMSVAQMHEIAEREAVDKKMYAMLSWTMLLHDVAKPDCVTIDAEGITHFHGHAQKGKEMVKAILRRLRFDNCTLHFVTHLIEYHDYRFNGQKKNMRKMMNKIGEAYMPFLFMVQEADFMAQSMYKREEKRKQLQASQSLYGEILAAKECVSLKTLAVNGSTLIANGFPKGKEIGEILEFLLQLVLEQPECNEEEYLLAQAKKHFSAYME